VAAFTSGAPVCRHRVRRIKGPLPGLRLSSLWERVMEEGPEGGRTGDGGREQWPDGKRGEERTDTVRNGAEGFQLAARLSPGVTFPPPSPSSSFALVRQATLDVGWRAAFVVKSSPVRPISFLLARFPVYRVYPPPSRNGTHRLRRRSCLLPFRGFPDGSRDVSE